MSIESEDAFAAHSSRRLCLTAKLTCRYGAPVCVRHAQAGQRNSGQVERLVRPFIPHSDSLVFFLPMVLLFHYAVAPPQQRFGFIQRECDLPSLFK